MAAQVMARRQVRMSNEPSAQANYELLHRNKTHALKHTGHDTHCGAPIVRDKYLPAPRSPHSPADCLSPIFHGNLFDSISADVLHSASIRGDANLELRNNSHESALQSRGLLILLDPCNENNFATSRNNEHLQDAFQHIAREENDQCGGDKLHKPLGRKERQSIHLALFLVAAVYLHNAPTCSGLSHFDNDHYTDPVRFDNHPRQHLTELSLPSARWIHRPKRRANEHLSRTFFDDDSLTGTMSTLFGSISQDQSGTNSPPPGVAQSWTSIFGGGASSSTTGGGGDALDNHVKSILVPRVSGTPGNVQVRQYIVDALRGNNYHVELDEFTASTPIGNIKFANIIADSNPSACRQLVLACHYDSKLQEGFLGATDSAVPCAMLLSMSETFAKAFRASDSADESAQDQLGLRFIFFDGEEAFVQWTSTDSLYGSRHLAAKWAKQPTPGQCAAGSRKTELDRIELFVLLDLIGASDTSFVMYNTQLRHHYEALQKHEKAYLIKSGLSQVQARRQLAFKGRSMPLDFVEDDHVPFKKRGVPILLLLAHPFPRVWHTNSDNYQSIDWPRTRRVLHVMEQFVSGYPNKLGQR